MVEAGFVVGTGFETAVGPEIFCGHRENFVFYIRVHLACGINEAGVGIVLPCCVELDVPSRVTGTYAGDDGDDFGTGRSGDAR